MQSEMFGSRDSNRPTDVVLAGFYFFSSTTWMFRRAHMDDFKVRAACRHLEFKPRITWNEQDEDGDYTQWVMKWKEDASGKVRPMHVLGPDNKPLKQKRRSDLCGGGYVRRYDPEHPTYPSHAFSSFEDRYYVRGDDGQEWRVGSRGNDHAVLRQEIINNPIFWPEEKAALLKWFSGDRQLLVEPDAPPGETEAIANIIRTVDGYFCQRIQGGAPTTEDDIRQSGLPVEIVENLIYNLRNYTRPPNIEP